MDDELAPVLLERAPELVGVGRHRARVVHDRTEPEQEERSGDDERDERERPVPQVLSLPQQRGPRGSRRTGSRGRSRRSDGRRRARAPRRPSMRRAPIDGERTDSSASASAAGTRSWRDDVAGSARNTYAPPMPGAKQIIATCAPAVTPAAHVRRKSAQPASNATTTASGARIDGRWVTTRSGSSPRDLRDQRDEAVPEREGVARDAGCRPRTPRRGRARARRAREASVRGRGGTVRRPGPTARRSRAAGRRPRPRRTPTPGRGTLSACRPAAPDPDAPRGQRDDDEHDERQRQRRAERERDARARRRRRRATTRASPRRCARRARARATSRARARPRSRTRA